MTTSSRQLVPASTYPQQSAEGPQALGFSVNLDSGRGLLTARDRRLGPLAIDKLSLEIPHLAFPFDISGGAARFRHRRCALVHLALHVGASDLLACFSEQALRTQGFARLDATVHDGYILLSGHVIHGAHAADFTSRIAPVAQGGAQVDLVFYDTRVYGFLPVPGAHLTRLLWRALRWPMWFAERPARWRLRPVDAFARELLPRGGWKIPAMEKLQDMAVFAEEGRLYLACDEGLAPAATGPDVPREALQATDALALHAAAEAALHEGPLEQAYLLFRRAVDDGQDNGWAARQLLHIGAALPEFATDTHRYAEAFLACGTHPIHARMALGSLAVHAGDAASAAEHFGAVGDAARAEQLFTDASAAWLAQSRAQSRIDLQAALQAGHAAVGLTPHQATAYEHMFALHCQNSDMEQAGQAAERWARYCDKSVESARTACDFGDFFRLQAEDFARARRMYEHALARIPEDPTALQGLAELYLMRGDTSGAITFFSRLATQREEAGDTRQAVSCHLRLADIWRHQLGDADSCIARLRRVVELDPTALGAMTDLADLECAAGRPEQALVSYQAVIQADTANPKAAPKQAVHAYTQALAILQNSNQRAQQQSVELAYLDRLVQLRPGDLATHEARLALLRGHAMRERHVEALVEQARLTSDGMVACERLMEAARMARDVLEDEARLRATLEAARDRHPAHAPALEMLIPLLQAAHDWPALVVTLASAAEATLDDAAKTRYLVALAEAQGELGEDTATRLNTLRRALALSPDDLPAAQALTQTLAADAHSDPEALAEAQEILARASTDAALQGASFIAAAQHYGSGPRAVAAARRAVAHLPRSAPAHLLLLDMLDAAGETLQVRQAFATAAQQLTGDQDLEALWSRQALWAEKSGDTALQLQALQQLAGMQRLSPEAATAFVMVLQDTGQTDRAVGWLEQWAEAGAPLEPGEALLQAAGMLRLVMQADRAHALLERVLLLHAPPLARRAAQALEDLAQAAHNEAWQVQAWRAHIAHVADDHVRAIKQACLLDWQVAHDDPEQLDTARALLTTQPCHLVACDLVARAHDAQKAWLEALDVRLAMLGEAPDSPPQTPPHVAARRRDAYPRAACVAADLRPQALPQLEAGYLTEFGTPLVHQPLSTTLTENAQWEDLLALRREQQRCQPDNLAWQRAIATLLHDHLDRADEAWPMWRTICEADPTHLPSLHAWLEGAERTGDTADQAAAHGHLARQMKDPGEAWQHALTCAQLHADILGDDTSAKAALTRCLGCLPPPQDPELLLERLMGLEMFSAVLALAPKHWRRASLTPAWVERIEQVLEGLERHFDLMDFVLHQAAEQAYNPAAATSRLSALMLQGLEPENPEQLTLLASAHAFCAEALQAQDPRRALEHCRQSLPRHPDPEVLTPLYTALLLANRRYDDLAQIHLEKARQAQDRATARHHFSALAEVCDKHLGNKARARWAIEQALERAPRDAALLRRLLPLIDAARERGAFVATAEALLAVSPEAQQDPPLLESLSDACVDFDKPRAVALLRQAMTLLPEDARLRGRWQALQDPPAPKAVQEAPEPQAPASTGDTASRAHAPANPAPKMAAAPSKSAAQAASKSDPVLQNIAAWEAAVAREPRNLGYRERFAAACAQSPEHRPKARGLFLDLVQRDCTHTPWLRVLARLSGAAGDRMAAYAYYAALLAVQPDDSEAHRFVHACRQLRPPRTSRPFANADWETIRANFVPCELTEQSDANPEANIAPRALEPIAANDARVVPLLGLLEFLGIPAPPLRLWPAGGRQCVVAPSDGRPLMLGAALYNDLPSQAGLFLGLRAILHAHDPKVHPAHGNNAALLLTVDVAEAIDALCASHGMTLAPQASRAAIIKKTPEVRDLLRFATSPRHLEMRRVLSL